MKKKLLLLLLVSFIVWNVYPYVDHAEGTTTVSTDQNNDPSKLNKQIESIQSDLKDLKEDKKLSTDTMSKEDLYNALLDREKDVSSSLYNFTMFFVSFVALAVAVGVIYFGKLARDVKEHQKKIDLVLDSTEFDEKMNHLQKKLSQMEAKERTANGKYLERYIKDFLKRAEFVIKDIDELIARDFSTPKIEGILKQKGFSTLKNRLSIVQDAYVENSRKIQELKEEGYSTRYEKYAFLLDEYEWIEERAEEVTEDLEKLHEKIGECLASD